MSKPRFGLDIDGVIYDFDWAARQVLLEMGCNPIPPTVEWNHIRDVEPEGWDALWSLGTDSYKLFRRKEAVAADAKTFVTNLRSLGYEVILVTCRPQNAAGDTYWLSETLGADGYVLVKEGEKYTVGCDIYLDDSPEEILALVAQGTPTIIMDKPWNVSVQGMPEAGDAWVAEDFSAALGIAREYICSSTQEISAVEADDDESFPGVVVPIHVTEAIRESVQEFSPAVVKLAELDGPRGGPCARAIDLVYGDRQASYSHPSEDLARVAAMWSVIFRVPIQPHQVAEAMIGLKLCRLVGNPDHKDSEDDIAGWAEVRYRLRTGA